MSLSQYDSSITFEKSNLLSWINSEFDKHSESPSSRNVSFPDSLETSNSIPVIELPNLIWSTAQINLQKKVYEQRLNHLFIQKGSRSDDDSITTGMFKSGVQTYQEEVSVIVDDYMAVCSSLQSTSFRIKYLKSFLIESDWEEEIHRMNEDGPLKYLISLRKKVSLHLKESLSKGLDFSEACFTLPECYKFFWPNIQTVRLAFASISQLFK